MIFFRQNRHFSFSLSLSALLASVTLVLSACNPLSDTQLGSEFHVGLSISASKSTVQASAAQVGSGAPVTVTLSLKDQNGAAYISALPVVTFSNVGGTSTGTFGTVTNLHDGSYSTAFTGQVVGSATTIHAQFNGQDVTSVLPNLQVTPGLFSRTNSTITLSAATVASGSSVTATLSARDAAGNSLSSGGLTVGFTNVGGTSTGSFGAVVDLANGTYTASFTGALGGTATGIQATIQGQSVASTSPQVTVTGGTPSTIIVSTGNAQSGTAGSTLGSAFTAIVKDINSTVLSAVTVDWVVTVGGGSVSTASNSTNGSGLSSSTLTLGTLVGTNTVSATVQGTAISTTFTATGSFGAASKIAFTTSPGNTVTGVAFTPQPVVKIEDQYGNLVTTGGDSTVAVALTLTTGPGTLAGTAAMSAVGGVADFTGKGLSINLQGTADRLTAAATILAGPKTATSSTFNITLGSAFTADWPFNPITPAPGSTYTTGSNIDFTSGVVRLSPANQIDDTSVLFNNGSFTGGALFDSSGFNPYGPFVRLATTTPNLELDSSWTPAWGNLVGYWKLNGNAGAIVNSSSIPATVGSAGVATISAGTLAYAAGKINQGIQFGGVGNSVDLPIAAFTPTKFTVSWWMYPTSCTNYNQYIGSTFGWGAFVFVVNSTCAVYVGTDTATRFDPSILPANTVTLNQWQMMSLTFNSGTASFYKNGVLLAKKTGMTNPVAWSGLKLSNPGSEVVGTVDEPAVWNDELSNPAILSIYQHQSAQYAGTFTSRVIDGLAAAQIWQTLGWNPTLPFNKALPDGGASESPAIYASQSSNLMSGIVGLWHLNEAAGTIGAGSVKDSSGLATPNNGTPSNVTFGLNGKLGAAASFDGTSSYILNSNTVNTAYATVAAWINISAYPSSNGVILGFTNGNAGNVDDKQLYLDSAGKVYFYVYDGGLKFTSTPSVSVPLNTWTHVVGTTNGTTAFAYMNGVQVGSVAAGNSYTSYSSANLLIGGSSTNGFNYLRMLMDEAAIWNRALTDGTSGTPNEILELYRRGANRLMYQVRSCADSACATGSPSWLGPDGTNQTFFSELYNTASNSLTGAVQAGLPTMTFSNFGAPLTTNLVNNRYFQYRTILESDDANSLCNYGSGAAACSPELSTATIGPTHYSSTTPTVTNVTGVSYHYLTGLTETLGSNGCAGGSKYELSLDGSTWYYYTGAAWALANGTYAQATVASALTGVIMNGFAAQVGTGSVFFKAFLKSDGLQACEIDDLGMTGNQ